MNVSARPHAGKQGRMCLRTDSPLLSATLFLSASRLFFFPLGLSATIGEKSTFCVPRSRIITTEATTLQDLQQPPPRVLLLLLLLPWPYTHHYNAYHPTLSLLSLPTWIMPDTIYISIYSSPVAVYYLLLQTYLRY